MKIQLKFAKKYYVFLDNLKKVGVGNMLGTASHLNAVFPELNEGLARKVIVDWMATFGARHPQRNERGEDEKQRNHKKQSEEG